MQFDFGDQVWRTRHACQEGLRHLPGMKEVYKTLGVLATSTAADTVLIRSHIAYWSGNATAERAEIKSSRGHTYKVLDGQEKKIVKISNHYDHRDGIEGWN